MIINRIVYLALLSCLVVSCGKSITTITTENLIIELNNKMETRVNSKVCKSKPFTNEFSTSEYLVAEDFDIKLFETVNRSTTLLNGIHGKGKSFKLTGLFKHDGFQVKKCLVISIYDSFPGMAFYKVSYINTGKRNLQVTKWVNNSYSIASNNDKPKFWSFQGQSTKERAAWILPVDSTFSQLNFMGMNNTDYGGGIPITDIWRRDAGIAIGHVELVPKLVSLPVYTNEYTANAKIDIEYCFEGKRNFFPGDTIRTFETFVSVHTGDCFVTLSAYSKYMQQSGIKFVDEEPEAFEPVWCTWGYWNNFTMSQIEGTLKKVKDVGINWIDIDDGYAENIGDWRVVPNRFPNGEASMRQLSDKIHSMGMKAKIRWSPLAVRPEADLLKENPTILLRTKDGAPQFITGWDCYFLSPDNVKTAENTSNVLRMYLQEWNYDGLKICGMQINNMPPDYSTAQKKTNPNESNENLQKYFKSVYNITATYKPNAVIQNCPCGECISFYNLATMNQAVASGPLSSWQTRSRCKIYKALRPGIAYYADHVELSDDSNDFASQVGIGGVIGTKFTWPGGDFKLTPEKEVDMKKWIGIYRNEMLSKANYCGNLYDIGYDKPETHAIQKGDTIFYAFYANVWSGVITLKGLKSGNYTITDFENNKELGEVNASNPEINANFKKHLLIKVTPIK